MKHYVTTTEAATLHIVAEKLLRAISKSPNTSSLLNIDAHDLAKIRGLVDRLGKKDEK